MTTWEQSRSKDQGGGWNSSSTICCVSLRIFLSVDYCNFLNKASSIQSYFLCSGISSVHLSVGQESHVTYLGVTRGVLLPYSPTET